MKRSSSSHVRTKIMALLAALAALWGFAAVVTVRDGLNVLYVSTVDREVGRPTNLLVAALQQERRMSVVAVVSRGAETRAQLAAVRTATDEMLAAWRGRVDSTSLDVAASSRLKERIAAAAGELTALPELRDGVDGADLSREQVRDRYTEMIDAGFAIYSALSRIDDQEIARQVENLLTLTRGRELLARQDALLAGVLAEGVFTPAEIAEFQQLVGTQRTLYEIAALELPPAESAIYQAFVDSPAMTRLRETEDRLIAGIQPGVRPPVTAADWQQVIQPAFGAIYAMELSAADRTLDRANSARTAVIVRLVLAGGLGLIAVIAAVVISITTARSLVRQLERLRDAARELASIRLPRVVERLSSGEKVDVAAEAPPLRFGNDEIGQLGQAFTAVQETAVRAAVQQAELRHGVRDVFLSLARRTQNLVHKQLSIVDGMERRETDADEMEDLYRIDHLATRMRRNAENLIVLAGSSPGRVWRRPVPMVDVVRGAIAEVEDYQRVNLMPVQGGALEGRVAGDVIHLLAELIENAASFSPPYAKVSVAGQRVAHGFVVEIEDRGLGIADGDLAVVNQRLAEPPDFQLADASRLGHYVVSKLAQRHGIRVHLRTSPYGGITAIVLIPKEIMLEVPDEEPVAVSAVPAPPPQAGPADSGRVNGSGTANRGSAVAVRQARPIDNVPAARPPDPATPDSADALPVRPKPDAPSRTPAGLPWRVRQASLPRQLLHEDDDGDEFEVRDPEQVRRTMSSFQLGTQRGRSDAGDNPSNHQEGDR